MGKQRAKTIFKKENHNLWTAWYKNTFQGFLIIREDGVFSVSKPSKYYGVLTKSFDNVVDAEIDLSNNRLFRPF